jgi:signal transduction histidine kinase
VLVYAAKGDAVEGLDVRTVSLRRILNSLVTMLQLDAEHKGIHLDLSGASDDVIVRTDEEHLVRIVMNLVSNALKFTPVGGKVVVRYRARRASVRILVWDNGPEIPRAAREKIFKPFVRLSDSEDGFGLGLAIARASARGLGGDLSVRSSGGHGAVFILRLPWTQEHAQA